jgi:catalase (peroxidase I)
MPLWTAEELRAPSKVFAKDLGPGDYFLCPHVGGTDRVISNKPAPRHRVRVCTNHDVHVLKAFRSVGLSPIMDEVRERQVGAPERLRRSAP